jgi:hypothetical protein
MERRDVRWMTATARSHFEESFCYRDKLRYSDVVWKSIPKATVLTNGAKKFKADTIDFECCASCLHSGLGPQCHVAHVNILSSPTVQFYPHAQCAASASGADTESTPATLNVGFLSLTPSFAHGPEWNLKPLYYLQPTCPLLITRLFLPHVLELYIFNQMDARNFSEQDIAESSTKAFSGLALLGGSFWSSGADVPVHFREREEELHADRAANDLRRAWMVAANVTARDDGRY